MHGNQMAPSRQLNREEVNTQIPELDTYIQESSVQRRHLKLCEQ